MGAASTDAQHPERLITTTAPHFGRTSFTTRCYATLHVSDDPLHIAEPSP